MRNCDRKIELDILLTKQLHLLASFANLVPFVPKESDVHAGLENHSKVFAKNQMLKIPNEF